MATPNNRFAYIGITASVSIITCLAIVSFVPLSNPNTTELTQLQDFCVGVNDANAAVLVNGLFCKYPAQAKSEDFFRSGLDKPGFTDNKLGFNVSLVSAFQMGGINTLGISIAKIDYAPYGLNPLHSATEVLTVLEGTLYVGFVASNLANGDNQIFSKGLNKGDVFVFPQGLIHFQFNIGKTPTVAFAALSSQNPGTVTIGNSVFRADQPISVDVLAKAFQLDANVVQGLQDLFVIYCSTWCFGDDNANTFDVCCLKYCEGQRNKFRSRSMEFLRSSN